VVDLRRDDLHRQGGSGRSGPRAQVRRGARAPQLTHASHRPSLH
jgi:hypothetical protein